MAGLMDLVQQFTQAHSDADPVDVQQAASDHLQSVDPQQFQQSVRDGVQNVPDHQVGGIAGTLMGMLKEVGHEPNTVAQNAGLGTPAPQEMNKGDLGNLLGYVQQYAPAVLGKALSSHPEIAQALGGPALQGILGKLGAGL